MRYVFEGHGRQFLFRKAHHFAERRVDPDETIVRVGRDYPEWAFLEYAPEAFLALAQISLRALPFDDVLLQSIEHPVERAAELR